MYDEELSTYMSKVLRHKGIKYRVPIDTDGYAIFSDLMRVIPRSMPRTEEDVLAVVEHSAKWDRQRFELSDDPHHGRLIRATRKHSLDHVYTRQVPHADESVESDEVLS